jgi:hypothetical protein
MLKVKGGLAPVSICDMDFDPVFVIANEVRR